MLTVKANKTNSLKNLGYKITEIKRKTVDKKGNIFVLKVEGPPQVFFIKQTKRGKMLAYRDTDDKLDVTINGLFDFVLDESGDLVGRREPLTTRKTHAPVISIEEAA